MFLRARTVTVPWPRVGDTTGEGVDSDGETLKAIVKQTFCRLRLRDFYRVNCLPRTVTQIRARLSNMHKKHGGTKRTCKSARSVGIVVARKSNAFRTRYGCPQLHERMQYPESRSFRGNNFSR